MATIDLRDYSDEEGFVLHFGGRPHEVNTYTFANALVAFSDAYRELHGQVYLGEAIELRLEALAPGSFRGKVKGIRKGLTGLMSGAVQHVVLPILVTFLYTEYLVPEKEIVVEVSDDHVVSQHGDDRIIVPREAYNQSQKLPSPERVRERIGKTIEAVEEDESVESIGVARTLESPAPMVDIPRKDFSMVVELSAVRESTPTSRVKPEKVVLNILKAVFSDQRRKWDFVWNGVKISAYINDAVFTADIVNRKYTIGTGDAIECILDIDQERDESAGVWLNVGYAVKEVLRYIPATQQSQQSGLFDGNDE